MTVENFISFGISVSYFVGIFFAFLKFNFITDILLGAFIVAGVFMLIVSLSITLVLKYEKIEEQQYLETDIYDSVIEDYKVQINRSHSKFENLASSVRELNIEDMMEKDRIKNAKSAK